MNIDICTELHDNFLEYTYMMNSQRAFADARDGLKPGQRACLWEMFNKGYTSNKPHVKSAKISGGVIATWWPHGDVAIYETFARMSQSWINNIPEVDWHGGNGSVVGGSDCASQRYTEARLSKAAEDGLFGGIKKQNVPFILNFSEDEEWPEVLPAIFPRLLVNGCQGIGSTIANTWLPNNLSEVAAVIIKYVKEGILDYSNMSVDFPSGGVIINKSEIKNIYETGKGKVILRAKTEIDGKNILITELPYQVYVEPLVDSIKTLINEDKLSGISDIKNKSDKKRMLIEIECDGDPNTVLKKLFELTALQSSYHANQYALVGKTPTMLTLKDYIDIYLKHNLTCIQKEYEFDLKKYQDRLEIVNGLLKAIEHIDAIIALIKKSDNQKVAKENLISTYQFTERQAQAIVDMKLGRLARLEGVELNHEAEKLTNDIEACNYFLSNIGLQYDELINRLEGFVKKYGTPRRTQLTDIKITKEAKKKPVIEPKDVVVVINDKYEIKRIPKSNFKVQNRGGKGVKTNEIIKHMISTNTLDTLMVFTNLGKLYKYPVDSIPEGTNKTKGASLRVLIGDMETGEEIIAATAFNDDSGYKYALFVTRGGLVKKTDLGEYSSRGRRGLKVITLKDGDSLTSVHFLKDDCDVILATNSGKAIHFMSSDINPTGRTSMGVKGIDLANDDYVTSAEVFNDSYDYLAIVNNAGIGKKIYLDLLPIQKRGGKGVYCSKTDISTIVGLKEDDNISICTSTNSIVINEKDIPLLATRDAAGVQLCKNEGSDKIKIIRL